jgi:hypothetical protein
MPLNILGGLLLAMAERATLPHCAGIVSSQVQATRPHLDARRANSPPSLSALLASVTTASTIRVHAARNQGATKEQIVQALGVAIAVNAGAALAFSARVVDAHTDARGSSCADEEVWIRVENASGLEDAR